MRFSSLAVKTNLLFLKCICMAVIIRHNYRIIQVCYLQELGYDVHIIVIITPSQGFSQSLEQGEKRTINSTLSSLPAPPQQSMVHCTTNCNKSHKKSQTLVMEQLQMLLKFVNLLKTFTSQWQYDYFWYVNATVILQSLLNYWHN